MEERGGTERQLIVPGLCFIYARLDKGERNACTEVFQPGDCAAFDIDVDPLHATLGIYKNETVGNKEQKRSCRAEILMLYDTVSLYRGLYARRRC